MKGWNDTMKNENKALTTTNSAFMALKDFNLNDALSEELSGLSGSFERIKIPAGGMTVFEFKHFLRIVHCDKLLYMNGLLP